jgi:purine nucleotide phosphorylase/homotetrameric cytidine deaminase
LSVSVGMHDLVEAAKRAREGAYAPYSKFLVGAAVRSEDGRIFAGCNVENASYPLGTCAEAGAIAAMVAAGQHRLVEAVVLGDGDAPCTPCGACRQRLAEFAAPNAPVEIHDLQGLRMATTVGELLPHSFVLARQESPSTDPVAVIRQSSDLQPVLGIVLGSGLGMVAERIESPTAFPYGNLPGFPEPSVPGHAGRLLLGRLAGVPIACLEGRVHLYEGRPACEVDVLVSTLARLGCRSLLLTNAAGSLRAEVGAGSLVLIEDHINLAGTNPLVGMRHAEGSPFLDLSEVYSPALRDLLTSAAQKLGVPLPRGVYLQTLGPVFETPAEIRAFRMLGADLVGMSTVPEAICARRHGLKVAAISIVTNLAAGMAPGSLAHEETLDVASKAAQRIADLLEAALPTLAQA